ncbi:MAG TPA: hypothetical protein VF559_00335 [Caulobacteraceae bacterium]|jgi:hypothetical protein
MPARLLTLSLLVGGACLAACGHQDDLTVPPPMFGEAPQASTDQTEARAAAARARAEAAPAADPQGPQSAEEQRNWQSNWQRGDVPPPRSAPIQGAPPDPNAPQPQGALPDPYNYPGQSPG